MRHGLGAGSSALGHLSTPGRPLGPEAACRRHFRQMCGACGPVRAGPASVHCTVPGTEGARPGQAIGRHWLKALDSLFPVSKGHR